MENNTYYNILIDTLTKKIDVLDKLIQKTANQEKCLLEEPLNMENFMVTVSDKQVLIKNLDMLDDGFEKVYDHIRDGINSTSSKNIEKIEMLQSLIKQVMEKSAKLQSLEMNNKIKLEVYSINKRKEIKNFKVSRRTAAMYYKNMPYQHYGQSCFFNKKK